jgi:hypothetical protein
MPPDGMGGVVLRVCMVRDTTHMYHECRRTGMPVLLKREVL